MSTLPKIIAVDFDGTLFENAWPDVGAPIEKNINLAVVGSSSVLDP